VLSFTILTTTPSADVAAVHDRMPVVVSPADRDLWLGAETPADALLPLLRPAPDGLLRMHAVSTAVNRPAFDGPDLIVGECLEPPDAHPRQQDVSWSRARASPPRSPRVRARRRS